MTQTYNNAINYALDNKFEDAIKLFKQLKQTDEIKYDIATCYKDIFYVNKGSFQNLLTSKNLFFELINKKTNRQLKKNIQTNYIAVITLMTKYYIDNFKYDDAINIILEGLKTSPNNPVLVYDLGFLYKCKSNYTDAITYLCKAQTLDNLHLDTYVELINIYRDQNDENNLLKYIKLGLKNLKNNPYLLNDLGQFYTQRNHELARKYFLDAIKYNNNDNKILTKVYTNLGHLHSLEGNIKESLNNFMTAYNLYKNDMIPLQNYLMDMLYLDNIDYVDILKKHFEFGSIIQKHYLIQNNETKTYSHNKIRIGYVSGDFFGTHPMVHFLKCLLTNYSKNIFEIYCYSNNILGDTTIYSDNIQWRVIKYLTTENCLTQIKNDEIDVLIDLSGHTSGNRMDIFSNRAAKIQINYLGYPCITGIPNIDYYLIDNTFNYIGHKLLKLENCFTHFTPPLIPKCKLSLPFYEITEKKFITFGSFNKSAKINDSVVSLWNKLLDEFPTAILIIKKINNMNFKNNDRVKIISLNASYENYLEQYNQIDIAIDTFPYAGTTTTCESLLMGTPVVTLADTTTNKIHQNTTASILINSNLENLIATNEDEYIKIIKKQIEIIKNDSNYKNKIQNNFLNGNVTNNKQYIYNFENTIKKIIH